MGLMPDCNTFSDFIGYLLTMLLAGCAMGWVINKCKEYHGRFFGKQGVDAQAVSQEGQPDSSASVVAGPGK